MLRIRCSNRWNVPVILTEYRRFPSQFCEAFLTVQNQTFSLLLPLICAWYTHYICQVSVNPTCLHNNKVGAVCSTCLRSTYSIYVRGRNVYRFRKRQIPSYRAVFSPWCDTVTWICSVIYSNRKYGALKTKQRDITFVSGTPRNIFLILLD
jgi:hypothetical protein